MLLASSVNTLIRSSRFHSICVCVSLCIASHPVWIGPQKWKVCSFRQRLQVCWHFYSDRYSGQRFAKTGHIFSFSRKNLNFQFSKFLFSPIAEHAASKHSSANALVVFRPRGEQQSCILESLFRHIVVPPSHTAETETPSNCTDVLHSFGSWKFLLPVFLPQTGSGERAQGGMRVRCLLIGRQRKPRT